MWELEFNNNTNREFDILATRPNMPCTSFKKEFINIPGRDGSLCINSREIEDISISIKFHFVCERNKWQEKFRLAKKWLLSGGKELVFKDDLDYFYKVKNVTIGTAEREVKQVGEFEVQFLCDGAQYSKDGKKEIDYLEVSYNAGIFSKPIYIITGEGVCTLTVNGKTVTANIGQNLTIDTERMISYREDGVLQNTAIKGNYEDLYLQEGDNEITVTDGFECKVIPRWRCL